MVYQAIEFKRDKVSVKFPGNMFLGTTQENTKAFRIFCKELGADAVCTEILGPKSNIKFDKEEEVIATVEKPSKKLIADLEKNAHVKIIEINLLNSKSLDADSKEIIKSTKKPIIASVSYKDAEKAKALKVSGIILHFLDNGKEIAIDEKLIEKIKKSFPGKVLARGNIDSPENAYSLMKNNSLDGFLVSSFALEKPTIFEQCKNYFEKGYYNKLTRKRREKVVARFTELYAKHSEKRDNMELSKFNNRFLAE
jgi:tRNA-dihydrouridine synthase